MPSDRSLVSSAFLIGFCTFLSRLTGFARDILLTAAFGLKSVTDAFWFAFTIPNLLRRLFAEGAVAAAFVPRFSTLLAQENRAAAWDLLRRMLALQTVAALGVVVLIELAILGFWLVGPAGPRAEEHGLVLALTAIMQPFLLTIGTVALFSSVLNALGSFGPAALVSAVLNIAMLAGLFVAKTVCSTVQGQALLVACSVVIGGALQIVALLPALRARHAPIGWAWRPGDAEVQSMLASLGPVVLGQGSIMLGAFVDNLICWVFRAPPGGPATGRILGLEFQYPLDEGALATLNIAQRLYQFPLGIVGISIATAALPRLSQMVARREWKAWAAEVGNALNMALAFGLVSGALLIGAGGTFFRLLFEHGSVGPADTLRSAPVIASYGWGLAAFCVQHVVLRAFYSCNDTRTPLMLSLWFIPLNSVLSAILIWIPGVREAAFGYATSLTTTISVVAGVILLQRKSNDWRVEWRSLVMVVVQVGLAAAAAVAAQLAAQRVLAATRGSSWPDLTCRISETVAAIVAGMAVASPVLLFQVWRLRHRW